MQVRVHILQVKVSWLKPGLVLLGCYLDVRGNVEEKIREPIGPAKEH